VTALLEATTKRTQQQVLDAIDTQARRALAGQTNSDVRALIRMYDEALESIEAQIESVWRQMLDAADQRGAAGAQRTLFLQWKLEREAALMRQIRARLQTLRSAWTDAIRDGMLTSYEQRAMWEAYGLDMATPPTISVNMRSLTASVGEAAVNTPWKAAMFSDRVWAITDDLALEMQAQLGQAATLGDSVSDAVKRIRKVVVADGNVPPDYAIERLVRTEFQKAADRATQLMHAENSDIVTGEESVATVDARTDDGCDDLSGKILGTEEAREIIDENGFSDRPPYHPNCRCRLVPRLKSWKDLLGVDAEGLEEFDDQERMIRDPQTGKSKLVPIESFDSWRTKHGLGGRG
jgi:SPP1 gp7 family putative phage head morphogenesis protein